MKKAILILVVVLIAGLGLWGAHSHSNRPLPELPDGWKILCSTDGAKYGWVDTDNCQCMFVYDTKREAIERAISFFEFKNGITRQEVKPRDKYKWTACKEDTP